jgi:NTE family protein
MKKKLQTVSLVLGSGGARGYAHIGVIEELLTNGYVIKSISGSSMGALVGALYACGKLEEFKQWALTLEMLDVIKLVDLSLTGKGIIGGDKVFAVVEAMIGDVMIEDLDIKFTAVATDIIKQKEVWIQKGRLLDAVRASVAIPSFLTPKEIDGRYLIDGGVLNPLPIAPTLSDNTNITIAVSLNAKETRKYELEIPEEEHKKAKSLQEEFLNFFKKSKKIKPTKDANPFDDMGMFDIMGRTIDIMQNAVLECKMAGYSPDIIIEIPNDACGFYEFNKAYEMIELGRVITRESMITKK